MQCQAMLRSLLKADNIPKLRSSFAYSENWGQEQRFLSAASSKERSWCSPLLTLFKTEMTGQVFPLSLLGF